MATKHVGLSVIWLLVLLLAACQPPYNPEDANTAGAPAPGATAELKSKSSTSPTERDPISGTTWTPRVSALSTTPAAQQTVVPSETPVRLDICSPLAEINIDQLSGLVANPFSPPRIGSDDPHQGVDFADIDPTTRISLEGRGVQAALAGTVAGVILDRFPYGNAVLVETPLDQLPSDWIEGLALPTPAPMADSHPVLTCPTPQDDPGWDTSRRSLYIIYAHLQSPPGVQSGEQIRCGDLIGQIGTTGNALNPHLHVEMRVGPSGARFTSLAHYTANASLEEMRSYCQWRVSRAFQLLDPMTLFTSQN